MPIFADAARGGQSRLRLDENRDSPRRKLGQSGGGGRVYGRWRVLASAKRACRREGQVVFHVVAGRLTQSVHSGKGQSDSRLGVAVQLPPQLSGEGGRDARAPGRRGSERSSRCRRRRGKCFARSVLRETVGRWKVCWPRGDQGEGGVQSTEHRVQSREAGGMPAIRGRILLDQTGL
jgi:hypothetical protein